MASSSVVNPKDGIARAYPSREAGFHLHILPVLQASKGRQKKTRTERELEGEGIHRDAWHITKVAGQVVTSETKNSTVPSTEYDPLNSTVGNTEQFQTCQYPAKPGAYQSKGIWLPYTPFFSQTWSQVEKQPCLGTSLVLRILWGGIPGLKSPRWGWILPKWLITSLGQVCGRGDIIERGCLSMLL